jgi:hypothetical protein
MKLFLQATGKEWQKKQLQEKLKSMIKNKKASGGRQAPEGFDEFGPQDRQ